MAGGEADGSGEGELVAIDGGDGAGAAVTVLGDFVGDGGLPEELAGFGGKGADALATFEVSAGVEGVVGNGDRGEAAAASFTAPEELWWVLLPVGVYAGFSGAAIAIRATPLRPIFRGGEGGRESEDEGWKGNTVHKNWGKLADFKAH